MSYLIIANFLLFAILFCDVLAIRNGSPVVDKNGNRADFPYMAGLLYKNNFWCGGVIISKNSVLTAAHCLKQEYIKFLTIRVGGNSAIGKPTKTDPVKAYEVIALKNHPGYGKDSRHDFDIGIIWIDKKFDYDLTVGPIILPDPNKNFQSENGIVLGWGKTENGLNSNVLLKANLIVLPNPACMAMFQNKFKFNDRMICAWESNSPSRRAAPCDGDSGGPLVLHDSKNPKKDVLIGIVSAGQEIDFSKECTGVIPSIYTNVGYVLDWITQNLDNPPKKL